MTLTRLAGKRQWVSRGCRPGADESWISLGHAWLVDPLLETLELFALGADQRWVLSEVHRGHRTVRAEPFEAIELELGVLWAR